MFDLASALYGTISALGSALLAQWLLKRIERKNSLELKAIDRQDRIENILLSKRIAAYEKILHFITEFQYQAQLEINGTPTGVKIILLKIPEEFTKIVDDLSFTMAESQHLVEAPLMRSLFAFQRFIAQIEEDKRQITTEENLKSYAASITKDLGILSSRISELCSDFLTTKVYAFGFDKWTPNEVEQKPYYDEIQKSTLFSQRNEFTTLLN